MDDYQIREEQKGIKRRCLPLPESCWGVCADQEDGAVEITHLFVKKWGWGRLNGCHHLIHQFLFNF